MFLKDLVFNTGRNASNQRDTVSKPTILELKTFLSLSKLFHQWLFTFLYVTPVTCLPSDTSDLKLLQGNHSDLITSLNFAAPPEWILVVGLISNTESAIQKNRIAQHVRKATYTPHKGPERPRPPRRVWADSRYWIQRTISSWCVHSLEMQAQYKQDEISKRFHQLLWGK